MSGGAARNPNSLANLRPGPLAKWIPPDQVPRLVRLHGDQHLTFGQLAARFNVSRGAVAGKLWRAMRKTRSSDHTLPEV